MIYYVVTEEHNYTIEMFLDTWGLSLDSRFEVVPYSIFTNATNFPAGTYVLSDLERLTRSEIDRTTQIWEHLTHTGLRVLNHPVRTLRRYELLRTLFQLGENCFNVYRLSEVREPRRFPVLLRPVAEHYIFGGLHRSQDEIDKATRHALRKGRSLEDVLMIEFCDTSDSVGTFRTYSAFVVAGTVIPRCLYFSRKWKLKQPDLLDEEMVREEWEYVALNPHQEWLARIFRLANVDYGKIDYSLLDGKPQIWEINTNPILLLPPERYKPVQLPAQQLFADRVTRAFEELDVPSSRGAGFTVVIPAGWSRAG